MNRNVLSLSIAAVIAIPLASGVAWTLASSTAPESGEQTINVDE